MANLMVGLVGGMILFLIVSFLVDLTSSDEDDDTKDELIELESRLHLLEQIDRGVNKTYFQKILNIKDELDDIEIKINNK